jgi:group I intron endonuclease
MYKLYQITNTINGKSYIGITKLSIHERWNVHVSNSRKPKYPIHHAIAKYGHEVFIIKLLEESEDRNLISSLEESTIRQLKTHITQQGYNIAKGGFGGDLGLVVNHKRKETIKNLSPEKKQEWTKNLSMVRIGKKHSTQTKEKMSKLQKDRGGYGPEKHSASTKEKISKGNRGKTRSEISRQHYRESAKIRGTGPQLQGKKVSCLCCNRAWDLGNFAQHIRKINEF